MLYVTPGDPKGIGPEVACKAVAGRSDVVLVGDGAAIAAWGPTVPVVDTSGAAEPAEVAAIRWATSELLAGRGQALVTGPINKASLHRAGFAFTGHTDFLGHLCGVPHPVMAFAGGSLMVALVTVHLPLRAVPDAITKELVLHTIRTADVALRALGLVPRIAVCGLNPHAGDEGVLGREEIDVIGPAVRLAVGIDARGPMSAETAFRLAGAGEVDLVVAMYHDQGLAPLKLVDFGKSVNWTLGLPIVRTSVDHGTAYDIAGKGIADPQSMRAALAFADRLVR